MEELKNRKRTRLRGANYDRNGAVFLTICTKERRCVLSRIVGKGIPEEVLSSNVIEEPRVELTKYGQIADKYIRELNEFYNDISVESYVIMPNHIHILLWVKGNEIELSGMPEEIGPSRTPVPTVQNSIPARFVSTFKRFCNKEYGMNIWQYRSYDHIIRNHWDYEEHMRYIHENPIRWYYDELYAEE
jgi:REP element-mobilizing transposase RayT